MATQQLTIPMFPLGILLLPGETKTLHIFEEKYKQLISDCLENSAHFGIPYSEKNKLSNYGIEVKISKVLKTYDNGELDILIEGISVFKLVEYSTVLTPKLYGAGIIVYEDDITKAPSLNLQELISDYIWLAQQNTVAIDAYDNESLYNIARVLNLSNSEKYSLIKLKSVAEKENFLIQKIKLFKFILNAESKLQSKFILN